jgi:hypothetical protein
MHRLRFLLVLAFVVVLGASLARSQDGTNPFDKQDKQANHNSKQEKAKNDDSHRKHWWSPPHWFHKKHDSKTGAAANTATNNQAVKTPDNKTVAAANTPKTSSTSKTVTGARPTTKTVAQSRKTTGGKKATRHDCTPEQAKKTGCVVGKGSHKTAANPS